MRLGRVVFDLGYVVNSDDEEMVTEAFDCIYEDVMNAVKFNELHAHIRIVKDDPSAKEEDIPSFLLEKEEES